MNATENDSSLPRRTLLKRWCLMTSISLAVFAWLEFIAFGVIAWVKVGHSWWFLLLIAAWPPFFAFVMFVAYGMAQINSEGPPTRRLGSSALKYIMPRFYFTMVDYAYPFMANLPLILFPLFAASIGGFLVGLASCGKLNILQ